MLHFKPWDGSTEKLDDVKSKMQKKKTNIAIDTKTMRRVFIVFSSLLLALCSGHALFVDPAPRYSGDDKLKEFPCGQGLKNVQGPITSLSPGLRVIHFKETISHAGAPFRIALSPNNDDNFDNFVFLDHIPHCDTVCGSAPRDLYVTVEIRKQEKEKEKEKEKTQISFDSKYQMRELLFAANSDHD